MPRRCVEILSENDSITSAERQDHRLEGESGREEPLWPWVRLLQIHDLRARSVGEVTCELEIDGKGRDGDEETDSPICFELVHFVSVIPEGLSAGYSRRVTRLGGCCLPVYHGQPHAPCPFENCRG